MRMSPFRVFLRIPTQIKVAPKHLTHSSVFGRKYGDVLAHLVLFLERGQQLYLGRAASSVRGRPKKEGWYVPVTLQKMSLPSSTRSTKMASSLQPFIYFETLLTPFSCLPTCCGPHPAHTCELLGANLCIYARILVMI